MFSLFYFQVIVQGSRKTRNHHNKKQRFNESRHLRERHQRKRERRRHQQQQRKHLMALDRIADENQTNTSINYRNEFTDNKRHRAKRSISSPRHVEALVVADSSMVSFHQDGDVSTYLLTIMNMVSSLYKDPAIGNLIKVVVVRIVLLEEDEATPDFNVTHLAENNLQNFCRYVICILILYCRCFQFKIIALVKGSFSLLKSFVSFSIEYN